ncbi:insecticidal delta-endotoxin Cry8Ea1 family protein [Streptomyces tauricus]|uniref:insecticidal delta-endotoxin Cry8Ea1 family protein n=1 Tax=Streptomyces tauricus TaxID=68274 RepID=UPI0016728C7E|nr:insecticidal delta-endotoxin Cry8Ea1 family protein [Streptomyces tauricus]
MDKAREEALEPSGALMDAAPETFRGLRAPQEEEFDPDKAQDIAKEFIVYGIGLLPGGTLYGAVASSLFKVFWPSSGDAWDSMRQKVEEIVAEAIRETWQKIVSNQLHEVKTWVGAYSAAAAKAGASGSEQDKQEARNAHRNALTATEGKKNWFMDKDHGWHTLPIFAQYANLHILLLRDVILHAQKLGMEDDIVKDAKKKLREVARIEINGWPPVIETGTYVAYVYKAYKEGCDRMWNKSWNAMFDYQRVMHLAAVDYAERLWPILADPSKTPTAVDRDYYLWLGPFGCDRYGYKEWVKEHWPFPKYKKENALQDFGIYTGNGASKGKQPSKATGMDARFQGGDWLGTQGDTGHTWWPVKNWIDTLWVHSHQRGIVAVIGHNGEKHYYGEDWPARQMNFKVDGFKIRNWRLENCRADKSNQNDHELHEWWTGMSGAMFGFRPYPREWKPRKIGPLSGNHYIVYSAETGKVLDLERYVLDVSVPVRLEEPNGSSSQQWRFEQDDEGYWVLINRYSEAALALPPGPAEQDTETDSLRWRLTTNEDHTHSLRAAERPLTDALSPATGQVTDRWIILPAPDMPATAIGAAPAPRLDYRPEEVDGKAALRLTLTLPDGYAPVEDWKLRFALPAEAGAQVQVSVQSPPIDYAASFLAGLPAAITGDLPPGTTAALSPELQTAFAPAADSATQPPLASVTENSCGVQVEVVPADGASRSLSAGNRISFLIITNTAADTLHPATLKPADVRLNGMPLLH